MLKFFICLSALILQPFIAFAAEKSGVEPHMAWRVINFVLFVGILYYFLKKPMVSFFKSRRESIINELEEAKRLQEEAEKLLEEAKEKLSKLEEEIKNILETFESMANNERQQILKDMENAIKRILNSVEEEKASIISKAKMSLLRKMSEEAIENLKRKFKNLSPEEHFRINDKFVRSLQ